ncbi:uncharacterized protein [Rutidosis leptorrhynchoides]|uniref:uncharacterized protein n=1 Tax=Rutidosis leptorrhynchoides TaxID=125765 RepID=UPI003A99C12A
MENDAFWVRVIKSIHGRDGGVGFNDVFGKLKFQFGMGLDRFLLKFNIDFANTFTKVVNDGKETFFWKDKWIGDQPLCVSFNRLYRLETNKDVLVQHRFKQNGPNIELNWSWNSAPMERSASE